MTKVRVATVACCNGGYKGDDAGEQRGENRFGQHGGVDLVMPPMVSLVERGLQQPDGQAQEKCWPPHPPISEHEQETWKVFGVHSG